MRTILTSLLLLGALFIGTGPAHATVTVHTATVGMPLSTAYTVTADGNSVPVYQGTGPMPYSYAYFDFTGSAAVSINSVAQDITNLVIRPTSKGISFNKSGRIITFSLNATPTHLSIEPNGRAHPLFLFTSPPETPPSCGGSVICYNNGQINTIGGSGQLILTIGQTLWIKGDTVLRGGIKVTGDNVTVRGRGVLDGITYNVGYGPHPEGGNRGQLWVYGGAGVVDNLTVEGLIFKDAWYTVWGLDQVDGIDFDNVKAIANRLDTEPPPGQPLVNGGLAPDGIHAFNTVNLTMQDSFIFTDDDCVAPIVHFVSTPVTENWLIERTSMWTQRANIFRIGSGFQMLGVAAAPMNNLVFQDLDILHYDASGGNPAIRMQPNKQQNTEDVQFTNIRINRDGQPRLIELRPHAGAASSISNVQFSEIAVTGTQAGSLGEVKLEGRASNETVSNVTFTDLVRHGQTTFSTSQGVIIGAFTSAISFVDEPEAPPVGNIQRGQSAEAVLTDSGNTLPVDFTASTTNGRSVVCVFGWSIPATRTLTSVQDDHGNIYQLSPFTSRSGEDGDVDVAIAWSSNIIGGVSPTVTANFSGSGAFGRVGQCREYVGNLELDKQAGQAQLNPGTATDAVTSGAVATTAAEELIFTVTCCGLGVPVTPGTGFTLLVPTTTLNLNSADKLVGVAGAFAGTWTADTATEDYGTRVATFKLAQAPPTLPIFNGTCGTLAWNANTESDLAGYRLFDRVSLTATPTLRNTFGSSVTTVACNTLGLNAGTHYMTLRAFDATLNEGVPSAEVGFIIVTSNQINDLRTTVVNANDVTLAFTEVDNGIGQPASYEIRFKTPTMDWGSATTVSSGTCAAPLAGTAIGATKTCTITSLSAATPYQFQAVPFRGTLGVNAIFGPLSNIFGATTGAGVPAGHDRVTTISEGWTRADGPVTFPWEGNYSTSNAPLTNPLVISGNQATVQAVGTDSIMSHNTPLPDDQWCQFTIKEMSGGAVVAPRCMLAMSNPGGPLRGFEFTALRNLAGRTSRIGVWINGQFTELASNTGTTWAINDVLRAEKRGENLSLFRNDVLLLLANSNAFTSGRGGLILFTAGSIADTKLDDVSFGTFTVPGGADGCGC